MRRIKLLFLLLLCLNLTGCEQQNVIDKYYISGTRTDFESIKSTSNNVFDGIVDEIPNYYTNYYKVDIEIINITKSIQSSQLTTYLVLAKYYTEDNKIGYVYDNWYLDDNNHLIGYRNIWTDVV